MPFTQQFAAIEPSRAEIDAIPGDTLIEFGTPWCGYCIGAQAQIEGALGAHPEVRHLKIEDGRGKPLGRSFRVKLWPTLVRLRDGAETGRLVRPTGDEVARMLTAHGEAPADSGLHRNGIA